MTDTPDASVSTRLAQARTQLSFQRTRMSTDRTLMSTLRTAFSMIGFGFTLFSFFRTLASKELLGPAIPERAPAMFGLALVLLGIVVLAHGLWSERQFRARLAADRARMTQDGLLPDEPPFPRGAVTISAFLLLLIGLFAVLAIAAQLGPFA